MPVNQTSGNLTTDAFGGGVAAVPTYIEDVFNTYLTTGASANITVVNGIDLAGKGGLVWNKTRSVGGYHTLFDTVRGVNKGIYSNDTAAQATVSNWLPSFNSDGFEIGSNNNLSTSGTTGVSWTFRKQPKFFTVGTYTGNGTTQAITHDLGSAPGCVIVKNTTTAGSWIVYHSGLTSGYYIQLNGTSAQDNTNAARRFGNNSTTVNPTSTTITVGDLINTSGDTWVYYAFASNAGGFGLTGTDNVITCGSFTTNSGGDATVNLGYEPQWILTKRSISPGGSWLLIDTMRGLNQTGTANIFPNTSGAETSTAPGSFIPTATGFSVNANAQVGGSDTWIYIAIRRGPMKVPTDATKVFIPLLKNNATGTVNTTGFPVDWQIGRKNAAADTTYVFDRLRGVSTKPALVLSPGLDTTSTAMENTDYNTYGWDNTSFGTSNSAASLSEIYWNFRRSPSFFDEVCFTATGSAITLNHNLGVIPEIIIIKKRIDNTGSGAAGWIVMSSAYPGGFISGGYTSFGQLQSTSAIGIGAGSFLQSTPTSTTIPLLGANYAATDTFVAYLFATCAGVSKVGSYTGNGTTQTINCGFTGGARFVLLKVTSTSGGWYVYDTARGMTTLTDPYLFMNATTAEAATLGSVTTVSTGFALNESILAGINTSGQTYIFLAIA